MRKLVFVFIILLGPGVGRAELRSNAERIELLSRHFQNIRIEAEPQNKLSGGVLSVLGILTLAGASTVDLKSERSAEVGPSLKMAGTLTVLTGAVILAGATDFEEVPYRFQRSKEGEVGGEAILVEQGEQSLLRLRERARWYRWIGAGLVTSLGLYNLGLYEQGRWGSLDKNRLRESGLIATGAGLGLSLMQRRFLFGGLLASAGLIQLTSFAWDGEPAPGFLLASGAIYGLVGLAGFWTPHIAEEAFRTYEQERGAPWQWSLQPLTNGIGINAQMSF